MLNVTKKNYAVNDIGLYELFLNDGLRLQD